MRLSDDGRPVPGYHPAVQARALLPLILAGCAHSSAPAPTAAGGSVLVQVLAFNDFHGNLAVPKPWKTEAGKVDSGGVAYFGAHLARLRATNPNTVVVSAGDLVGASPLTSSLFHDEPTVEAMNRIGLDLNAVGNHEFDEGPQELLRLAKGGCHPKDGCRSGHDFEGAKFGFLAANVFDDETGQTIFPSHDVRTFDGVRVAFIGMTLEATPDFVPPVVGGLRFADEAETTNGLVKKLQADGVEAIVVIVHEGGFAPGDYDGCGGLSGPIVDVVQRLDRAVDLVVTGHTHQAYNCEVEGLRVTSAGSYGRLVTDIDLEIDRATGEVTALTAKNLLVTHDVPADPGLKTLLDTYTEAAAPLARREIGVLAAPIAKPTNDAGESPLGSVIADGQLFATQAADKGAAELAFMNTGGIRTGLDRAGTTTYEDLFSVHPFGNLLVTMSLTGQHILEALQGQWGKERVRFLQPSHTVRYVWRDAPPHVRAEDVTIGGAPLDLTRTYRVTLNDYLVNRGVFAKGTDRLTGVVDIDALEAYLSAKSPLSPPEPGRIAKAAD